MEFFEKKKKLPNNISTLLTRTTIFVYNKVSLTFKDGPTIKDRDEYYSPSKNITGCYRYFFVMSLPI